MHHYRIALALTLFFGLTYAAVRAEPLPTRIAPPAPFPKILTQAPTIAFIAPGVTKGEYDLQTVAGPIVVRVVAVDLQRSDLHVGTVLAHDQLVSRGESIESMALRTGAVAGINGDYFDIDNTNTPLNILVQDGQLVHAPMQRYALGIDQNNGIHFEEYSDAPPDIVTAIGGGPLLLQNGAPFADPDGPNGAEFLQRIPASAVAAARDGTLFLIQVDGNQPGYSIGITRPELTALMRALGANGGMALDGGGSSTLVARDPGYPNATLQNVPSDGRIRPVADGLFVYSDASVGPPSRVVVQPGVIRAVLGAQVPLRCAVTDDAGHLLRTTGSTTYVARDIGVTSYTAMDYTLSTRVPVYVVRSPARLIVTATTTNVEPGEHIRFTARADDASGYPLALPSILPWSTTHGTITPSGVFTAGPAPAIISVHIGETVATIPITVGHYDMPFSLGTGLSFSTSPRGQPGRLTLDDPACPQCIELSYNFSGNERAAYAQIDRTLPAGTLGMGFDVLGNGSNALVRVKILNAINESVLLTATTANFMGWHHVFVHFPPALLQPAKLSSIYILSGIGGTHVTGTGTIAIKNPRIVVPRTGTPSAGP